MDLGKEINNNICHAQKMLGSIFLLAFAQSKTYRLGLSKRQSIYGLTILTWGAMTFGWHLYQWISPK